VISPFTPRSFNGRPRPLPLGLKHTALARACANTIRLKLLKIGAVITVSVRRVKLAMSEACPHQREFIAAFHALSAAAR
jgi:hypothetical protein